jgi:hypothetical protein
MWLTLFGLVEKLMSWFNRRNTAPIPVVAPVPFAEQMLLWLEELSWFERESSFLVSTTVFSKLRRINDILVELSSFITRYEINAEEEYILKATITDYIPSALALFNQLPAAAQVDGKEADLLLQQQCDSIERTLRQLVKDMHDKAQTALVTQTMFVDERFRNAPV